MSLGHMPDAAVTVVRSPDSTGAMAPPSSPTSAAGSSLPATIAGNRTETNDACHNPTLYLHILQAELTRDIDRGPAADPHYFCRCEHIASARGERNGHFEARVRTIIHQAHEADAASRK